MSLFDAIQRDARLEELARLLQGAQGPVTAEGLWGSSAPVLAALLAQRLGRPLLFITAHSDDADDTRDDIETVLGSAPELLPQMETLPGEPTVADDELAAERLRLCIALLDETAKAPASSAGAIAAVGPASPVGPASGRSLDRAAPNKRGPSRREETSRRPVPQQPQRPACIVAPLMALMQPVPSAAAIRERSRALRVGQRLDPDALAQWLADHGFERCDAVEVPGDFARRGGILDVFCLGYADPVRVEFFGDEIDSIRLFDAGTQRSAQPLAGVQIPALRLGTSNRAPNASTGWPETDSPPSDPAVKRSQAPAEGASSTTSFLSFLRPDTLVVLNEPTELQEIGRALLRRIGERVGAITPEGVFRNCGRFTQLYLQRFASGGADTVNVEARSLPQFEPKSTEALLALADLAEQAEVVVLCDNRPEEERFHELLQQRSSASAGPSGGTPNAREGRPAGPADEDASAARDAARGGAPPAQADAKAVGLAPEAPEAPEAPRVREAPGATAGPLPPARSIADADVRAALASVRTAVGVLHHGFQWGRVAFVPNHELFHRYRQRRTLRRVQPARPIDTFFDLSAGDHVVHVVHGIGKFLGLKALERDGHADEHLVIEFADHALVHVPVSQIHLVQKYIGSARGRPKLSKLGSASWKRAKERVAEAVTDLAGELLAIQARRAADPGVAYPHDTAWQREFEGSFIYTETADQVRALEEIKRDQTQTRPMDRLLCGDVGYGKTELAIRAAFKVAEYGRQVAVLVPTTVLAEQHFHTFSERLADYPFVVDVLSRFRGKGDQDKIVARAKRGEIDILIGTHRLLSKDVRFADLGLIVIDEEQRFGVEAKERLKQLRATVDVLTLTATPIPRTLHMAMLGIRDISSLQTAPLDRRSIVSQVRMWDDRLIRDALLRELNRDGQAYFVHNFVRDIEQIANHLRTLVPEARFVVGHGQMTGPQLEEVMLAFMRREADVLVSTNIIESGIDIPSANTIFINRAERFGLADMHQLRGRVGRSKHRAYAYAMLSPKHPVNDNAARRLKAFEHYSELGAGFQIALRDLEIRGAGNILGPEQSGHIEAVGYDMYCQLLEQAVRKMRNEPVQEFREVNVQIGVSAAIPRAYIRADRQRMDVYKRLTNCRSADEVNVLRNDLRDAFGPPPEMVEVLLSLAEIRVLAQPWRIRSIVLKEPDVIFAIEDLKQFEPLLAAGPGSPRVPDPHTVHWRLPQRYLEPATLLAVLRKQLGRGTEVAVRQRA